MYLVEIIYINTFCCKKEKKGELKVLHQASKAQEIIGVIIILVLVLTFI